MVFVKWLYQLCFLLFVVLLPFPTKSQSHSNFSLGSYVTASSNDNSSWVSPSGDFAFGFQKIDPDGFLLAIWFNKIPEKTVVWSANRNSLVRVGSKVQLTADGLLVLRDQSDTQVWIANSVGSGVAYAAMLDSGNFVLRSTASINLWESFSQPTDTILPLQTMNKGIELIARYSERNYSNGRFKFSLQNDGNLVLYTTRYPLVDTNFAYWSTQTMGSGFQVIFNQSGYIYLTASNGSILNYVSSNPLSMQDFYQRATVDYDGPFRHYVYPRSASSSSERWPMAWTTLMFMPSNICLRIESQTGSGACGFNSYCTLGNDSKPICQCPPGYVFIDSHDVSKGCKQNFVSQNCDGASQDAEQFEFAEMSNTDWPQSDYEYFQSQNEDWCRQACLSDCFCDVAIFRDGNCWKKKLPLSNGRTDDSVGGKALIKVQKPNSKIDTGSGSKKKDQPTLIITGSVLLGSSILLNALLLIVIFIFLSRAKHQKPKIVHTSQIVPDSSPRSFSYNELEAATSGFKEKLGSGAFGTGYRGVLQNDTKEIVAVKKLEKKVNEGEQEFKTEVNAIGRTNHKNLVKLLGFCNEEQHRLLVYEYMSNGSLADFLLGVSRPNWYKRMQIVYGIARGLLYLHEECSTQIIHCDIKPQNILLDESLTARISDFGLAKLLKADQTRTTTAIRGTKGYVAPEWFRNMPVTVKVDVYSFGILLLELVCCRRNVELDLKEECQTLLVDWAYDCYQAGALNLLVKEDEEALDDMKRVEKFVMVAIWCIQEDPSLRPTMKKVVAMLEGAAPVSIPPDPASILSTI
ncbi:hypothetical protein K2173_021751 [Erythroxylum novogranatense]|uniref:Receptor-like serine/threonine-protein kinase n=1 Tax=Erythroxylum novogranatense TaxID=1862640 RepID=A0AAV8TWE8_9ROSI|nr:hypothetical protein K2173_021751 [Erythroxylum novogranatense]